MGFHLLGYRGTVDEGLTPMYLSALADGVLVSSTLASGATGFVVPGEKRVIAAWAGSTSLKRARLVAPSMLRVGYPVIRPATLGTIPGNDPALATMFDQPLKLKDNELLSIDAVHGAVAAEAVTALAWITDNLDPVPEGPSFWVRYSSPSPVTANQWTRIQMSLEATLPEGMYAVIGMEHWSAGCVAARLEFPGTEFRPGVLGLSGGSAASGTRTHRVFYEGALGTFGRFVSFRPPEVEVLSSTADSSHEGYLQLVPLIAK